jgi:hypothetical protein
MRIGGRFLSALRTYPRRAAAEIRAARSQLDADRARNWNDVTDGYLLDRIGTFHDTHLWQPVPHAVASVIGAAPKAGRPTSEYGPVANQAADISIYNDTNCSRLSSPGG